jgi:hypothetical protein
MANNNYVVVFQANTMNFNQQINAAMTSVQNFSKKVEASAQSHKLQWRSSEMRW